MATYTATADASGNFEVDFDQTYDGGQAVKITSTKNAQSKTINLNAPSTYLGILDKDVTTWSGRTQEDRNKDFIHLKDFGAKANDPSFDNTAIIKTAIESGKSIDFGDINCNYYISTQLEATLTSNLFFMSRGAKITCLNVVKQAVNISANGFNIYSLGALTLECEMKAFTGMYITNENTKASNVHLESLNINNCYRSSTQYTGGDGIFIGGNLSRVVINDPLINGVYLAKDAGVFGSQGITGMTIARSSSNVDYMPEQVTINNPKVINVYSEDPDYYADQDGIRVFTRHSQESVLPTRTSFYINNPYFKNCLGRAFKAQGEIVTVTNPVVYRDKGPTRGYGNPEFDFQTGGGRLINATAVYKNTRPISLVYMYSSSNETKNKGLQLGSVDGFNVSIEYDTPVVHDSNLIVVSFGSGCDQQSISVKGVNVRGVNFTTTGFLAINRTDVSPLNTTVTIVGCTAPIAPSGGVVSAQNAMENTGLIVNLQYFKNTSSSPAPVTPSRVENFSRVRVFDCIGLLESKVGLSTLPATFINGDREYGELPVVGDRRGGGSVRFSKHRLQSGENLIPLGGYVGLLNTNMLLINIAKSKNSIGLFFTDTSGATTVFSGSEITNGVNAPSATPAVFDVWVTSDNILHINNGSTVTYATIQVLG